MRDKPRNYPIDVYFSYNRRDNPDNLPSGFFITVNKGNNPGNLPSGVYSSTARGTFWVGQEGRRSITSSGVKPLEAIGFNFWLKHYHLRIVDVLSTMYKTPFCFIGAHWLRTQQVNRVSFLIMKNLHLSGFLK